MSVGSPVGVGEGSKEVQSFIALCLEVGDVGKIR